eukprot:snap_masked-scaffold_34-processed-gene-0.29-mRNA-1 protein AED:1.00 eAED:1.00 QI:0/-1/0/0/-1/1/1/0/140
MKKIFVFGSRCFVKSIRKSKFQANEKAIFLGNDTRSKMLLAYIIPRSTVTKIRDTAWDKEGTLLKNSQSIHKVFQCLNEKIRTEPIKYIISSGSDTAIETTGEFEEKDAKKPGKQTQWKGTLKSKIRTKKHLFTQLYMII